MSARESILAKLRAAPKTALAHPDIAAHYQRFPFPDDPVGKLRHWARMMRSVKTEILWTDATHWPEALAEWADHRRPASLLLSDTPHGHQAAAALATRPTVPALRYFDSELDGWKEQLFHDVEAAFTRVRCGIAATGTLVLWPDAQEPRTMSLVPPIHIALFDTTTLHGDFHSAMHQENWAAGMPTNAVLVSGPSKTADIQLTLAYGAHGPRDLVVLAMLPDGISPAMLEEEGA